MKSQKAEKSVCDRGIIMSMNIINELKGCCLLLSIALFFLGIKLANGKEYKSAYWVDVIAYILVGVYAL